MSITFQLYVLPVIGLLDLQSISSEVSVLTLTMVKSKEFEGIKET